MNPPTAVQRPPAGSASSGLRRSPAPLLWLLVLMAGVVLIVQLVPAPGFVHRVSFANPTPYHLDVDVAATSHGASMPAGTAFRERTTTIEDVYDIGDVWWFRFSAEGQVAGTVRLTRADLQRAHWRVAIPDRLATSLEQRGVTPAP